MTSWRKIGQVSHSSVYDRLSIKEITRILKCEVPDVSFRLDTTLRTTGGPTVSDSFSAFFDLKVYFEGDNREGTIVAEYKQKIKDIEFSFVGFLPKTGGRISCTSIHLSQIKTVELTVDITVFSLSVEYVDDNKAVQDRRLCLHDIFHDLFATGAGSDVTLSVSGEDFRAHQLLLASRSAVFAKMFDSEMEERKSGRVVITDVDHKVFKEVLRYVYTNRVYGIVDLGSALLYAADKYDLQGLKDLCCEELSVQLTQDNVVDLLVAAHLVHGDLLKKAAAEYVISHMEGVSRCPDWIPMVAAHPDLFTEVFVEGLRRRASPDTTVEEDEDSEISD